MVDAEEEVDPSTDKRSMWAGFWSDVSTSMKSSWHPPKVTMASYLYLTCGCIEVWSSTEMPSSLMANHTLTWDISSAETA